MMKRYDCVVVGAGPAGATALRELSRLGVKACAIDKSSFPRYKPCGGAISALTSRELDFAWEDLIEASLYQVELAYKYGPPLICRTEKPFAHFVMRDRFDHRLLEEATKSGGRFYPGHGLKSLEVETDGVVVRTSGGAAFRAATVIGADGANSQVAREVGLFNHDRGIAVEAEVDAPPEVMEAYRGRVYLSYAEPPWGYGWIFPKAGRLSVGVGTFSRARKPVKDAFTEFLRRTGLAGHPMKVYGHPIPTGGKARPIRVARVLLAGDAAGLNDPLSGEGIAHAVLSGKIAARHVARALAEGDFSFTRYQEAIDERIVAELRRAANIAEKLYTFPRLFYWLFSKSPKTLELYFRLVRGEIRYEELLLHLEDLYLRFGLFRRALS